MHWSNLISDFKLGKPDAIEALSAFAGVITTFLGTLFIVLSFNAQRRINKEQKDINRLALEKNRREIRPFFHIYPREEMDGNIIEQRLIKINLENALAYNVRFNFNVNSRFVIEQEPPLEKRIWELNEFFEVSYILQNLNDNAPANIGYVEFLDEDNRIYTQVIKSDEHDNLFISKPSYT